MLKKKNKKETTVTKENIMCSLLKSLLEYLEKNDIDSSVIEEFSKNIFKFIGE